MEPFARRPLRHSLQCSGGGSRLDDLHPRGVEQDVALARSGSVVGFINLYINRDNFLVP